MLIDTNIFVEIARKQERYLECLDLLKAINKGVFNEDVYVSRFSLGALQALLSLKSPGFLQNILLLIYGGNIKIYTPEIEDDIMTLGSLGNFSLDFDDAVQFTSAAKLNTYLVTLDNDFKKTGLKIKTPQEVLDKVLLN